MLSFNYTPISRKRDRGGEGTEPAGREGLKARFLPGIVIMCWAANHIEPPCQGQPSKNLGELLRQLQNRGVQGLNVRNEQRQVGFGELEASAQHQLFWAGSEGECLKKTHSPLSTINVLFKNTHFVREREEKHILPLKKGGGHLPPAKAPGQNRPQQGEKEQALD